MRSIGAILLVCVLSVKAAPQVKAAAKCGTTPVAPDLTKGLMKDGNVGDDIVGGAVAVAYSWPWQIVWCADQGSSCSLMCGGSVIHNHWILTAGHCVYGHTNQPGSFRVKTGVFDETSSSESGEVVRAVKKIHLHPSYKGDPSPIYDMALIELTTNITYTNHIQPVCLPSQDTKIITTPNYAWATGWGTTSSGGQVSRYLRQVHVPFVNQTTCAYDYNDGSIYSNMVCAGKSGKDSCQGDSGGPLVHQSKNGYWFQYGVTSFGYGCGDARYPGVYARTSFFCSWISSTTGGAVGCVDPDTYA